MVQVCSSWALPRGCLIKGPMRTMVEMSALRSLQEVMRPKDILSAHEGMHPQLDRMRKVTCAQCALTHCEHNVGFIPKGIGAFTMLKEGKWSERINRSEFLLAALVSFFEREFLEKKGICCWLRYTLIPENPKIFISFRKNEKIVRITCEIGTQILRTQRTKEPLLSVQQVREKILQLLELLQKE